MIDAREEIMASATPQTRRRAATVTATRATKAPTSSAKKSLPIKRVFSDAKMKPFDQIE